MQSIRRSRSVLVELMIAVLFLAIAACVLAQLFATAGDMGMESRHTQAALLLARDSIERFAAGEILPETAQASMNGQDYTVETIIEDEKTAAGQMRKCVVAVSAMNREFARLETACYLPEDVNYEAQ